MSDLHPVTDDIQARAAQWVADHLPSEARQIVTDLLERVQELSAALEDMKFQRDLERDEARTCE